MKILYVSRHFNRSGFIILKRLIEKNIPIEAVLLHRNNDPWRKPLLKDILKLIYKVKCWYYRCKPLRALNSEESLAKKNNIPIVWADSIKSDAFYEQLQKVNPDIIVLGGGWHELIPKRVFSFPPLGCINTHPSLLPEFRGTSITRWQVLHGVEKSGSTIHYVDDTFDTGGVLAQKSVEVANDVSPQDFFSILGNVGADIMIPLLIKFDKEGKQIAYTVEHDKKFYNYYKRWQWDIKGLEIDWNKSFKEIHFKVLASTQESYEYLGVNFRYNKKTFFLRKTSLVKLDNDQKEFVAKLKDNGLYVYNIEKDRVYLCKKGELFYLVLDMVQKYDKFYRYRRAFASNKLLKLKTDTKFEYEK